MELNKGWVMQGYYPNPDPDYRVIMTHHNQSRYYLVDGMCQM